MADIHFGNRQKRGFGHVQVDEHFETFGKRIDGTEVRLATMEAELRNMSAFVAAMQTKIEALFDAVFPTQLSEKLSKKIAQRYKDGGLCAQPVERPTTRI